WAEPQRCGAAAELPARLDVLDRWQRELYPAIAGRSRTEAYPGLKHSGRVYQPFREPSTWEIHKVWELLGSHLVPRQVDRQGKVSVYNRPYSVGLRWAGRTIWVGFDPDQGAWTFQDEQGHEIRRQQATELTPERVRSLDV